jgi:hypothetical protein
MKEETSEAQPMKKKSWQYASGSSGQIALRSEQFGM